MEVKENRPDACTASGTAKSIISILAQIRLIFKRN